MLILKSFGQAVLEKAKEVTSLIRQHLSAPFRVTRAQDCPALQAIPRKALAMGNHLTHVLFVALVSALLL